MTPPALPSVQDLEARARAAQHAVLEHEAAAARAALTPAASYRPPVEITEDNAPTAPTAQQDATAAALAFRHLGYTPPADVSGILETFAHDTRLDRATVAAALLTLSRSAPLQGIMGRLGRSGMGAQAVLIGMLLATAAQQK